MNITKSCSNCGSVVFNLSSQAGKYQAFCSECGNLVGDVQLDKYVTVLSSCSNCKSTRFKAKVKKTEQGESWSVECVECKTEPTFRYVDSELNEIDEKTRENLILKDTISELNERITNLQNELLRLTYLSDNKETIFSDK